MTRTVMCERCTWPTTLIEEAHHISVWQCEKCGDYAECEHDGTKPLGPPTSAETHGARFTLRSKVYDPLWRRAPYTGDYEANDAKAVKMIQNAARRRINEFLADRLAVHVDVIDFNRMTIEQCRACWRALQGLSYQQIRSWSKTTDAKKEAQNVG